MDPKKRAYLVSLGLDPAADDAAAEAFYASLPPDQQAAADAAAAADTAETAAETAAPAATDAAAAVAAAGDAAMEAAAVAAAEAAQAVTEAVAAAVETGTAETAETDEDEERSRRRRSDATTIRQRTLAAERQRVQAIQQLAGRDVPQTIVTRAITDGWSVGQASAGFLAAIRARRGAHPRPLAGPAIHSRSLAGQLSVRSLAAGLMIAGGLDPTKHRLMDSRTGRRRDQLTERDADYGERFSRLSAVDLCRMCVQLDSGRIEWDPEEAIRTAISGGSLANALGTNVYAKLLEGWNEIPDSTDWCADEPDIPNFLQQEDITLNVTSRMEQLPRGGTATDATVSDKAETYKLARYAKKFTVDEQDLLNDRLGAIMQIPIEMGKAAARLRPDLVYATLLENPTMTDTGALFNATAITTAGGHENLGTGALSTTNFATALLAMYQQRKGDVVLNVRPRYLIVPAALAFIGAQILNGIALAKTHATKADPDYVPINPVSNQMLQMLQGMQIELRVDDRLGAAGVWDPKAKVQRKGSATNWFLSAGGPRTIRVGTRRGTGGLPQQRQYNLDRGQWGVGWDVNLDICVVVADYPGLYKSTGAA